jgi:hypothetical protein
MNCSSIVFVKNTHSHMQQESLIGKASYIFHDLLVGRKQMKWYRSFLFHQFESGLLQVNLVFLLCHLQHPYSGSGSWLLATAMIFLESLDPWFLSVK